MSEDDLFEKIGGSEAKVDGPWFKCKMHSGHFRTADKGRHLRAYHAKKSGSDADP